MQISKHLNFEMVLNAKSQLFKIKKELSKGNEQIFAKSYLYFSQVIKWKNCQNTLAKIN